jgi:RNA-directed DNA polymerase
LSPEKTLITHIDDGLDFLGWRIQRAELGQPGRVSDISLAAREVLHVACID